MATSALGAAGVIGIALVAAGVLNPILLVPIVVIGFAPLAVLLFGRLFRHAAPTANSGASGGPSAPPTAEAAYDPVARPTERG